MNGLKYLRNVTTLKVNVEKCIACSRCTEVCPHAVFSMGQESVQVQDRDACMECCACAINCPAEAITVNSGVGCAAAVINGALRRAEPDYGCSSSPCCD
jgi:NAD-dependent dihydropyrimidine dehydrogenase PreA subunit